MKKLEHLVKKNPTLICPADYTVQAFQEWTRTNPKIHAMQSEVLDMLAQKIKYVFFTFKFERLKIIYALFTNVWWPIRDISKITEKLNFYSYFIASLLQILPLLFICYELG